MIRPAAVPVHRPETSQESTIPAGAAMRSGYHGSVDYDLHGIVGIRLLDATPADVATITAQCGPIQARLNRDPDIVIRFVDRLETGSPTRLMGPPDSGYVGDSFLVLRGRHRASVRVEIPFDTIGRGLEIRCERGVRAVPLLIPIVNVCAVANGALPLHASAFRYRGRGILVTGWARGGKTEALLAFLANGAEYIGDEWVYLDANGTWMCGIPEPIRVWDWHVEDLPELRRRLGWLPRMRLRTLRTLATACALASGNGAGRGRRWQRVLGRVGDLVSNQCYAHLRPRAAFGRAFGSLRAPIDEVVFVESWDAPDIRVTAVAGREVAARMAFSLQEERAVLMSAYRRFRFAMPERANPLLDDIDEIETSRLQRVLGGRTCHAVLHPYPVSVPSLFHAARPLIEAHGA